MDLNYKSNWQRPENTPDMLTECPICFEPLFDDKGVANASVAKIMCFHLVHSDCLLKMTHALNADGKRYGVGALGSRAGCPICSKPVSFWTVFDQAADFPVFWMHRIQTQLEKIGPWRGPVSIDRVKELLNNDPTLTAEQKKYLGQDDDGDLGFLGALSDGDSVWVTEVVNGGPENGGCTTSSSEPGVWDYDQTNMTLWLHKWGGNTRKLIYTWMRVFAIVFISVAVGVLWEVPNADPSGD